MKTTTIELPNGIRTEEGIVTHLKIRTLGNKEDKLLGSGDLDMLKVIGNCIEGTNLNHTKAQIEDMVRSKNLYRPDSEWILIKIRMLTLGSMYNFSLPCPNPKCSAAIENQEYDLTSIEFVGAGEDEDDVEDHVLVDPTFKVSGDDDVAIEFRYPAACDSEDMLEIAESERNVFTRIMALFLVSIDNVNVTELAKRDGAAFATNKQRAKFKTRMVEKHLTNYNTRNDVRCRLKTDLRRVDTTVESRCKSCRKIAKHRLPITGDFLRPSSEQELF